MKNEEVKVDENSNRRVCKDYRCIASSSEGMGEEGYDTSNPSSIRSAIIQRAELERSRKPELDISERYGYIYLTENLINHKLYIGQHKAKKFDKDYNGSGILLRKALKKYGKDNFNTTPLEWCRSIKEINEVEIKWIKMFNCVNSNLFYNICEGGENFGTYVRNEEWRRKVSESIRKRYKEDPNIRKQISDSVKEYYKNHDNPYKGRIHSKEVRDIMRAKALGRVSPMKGKHHTEETKKIISNKNKGKSHVGYWKGKKQPLEANMKRSNKLKGDGNPFYGKHHSEEVKELIRNKKLGTKHSEETKRKISNSCKGHIQPESQKITNRIKQGKRIECIETGMVFLSSYEAAEWIGKCEGSSAIRGSARDYDNGISAMRYGYHWRYLSG